MRFPAGKKQLFSQLGLLVIEIGPYAMFHSHMIYREGIIAELRTDGTLHDGRSQRKDMFP